MKNEVKVAYLLFMLAVIGYLFKFALNVFLARHLAASLYGDYSVAIKILNILVTLSLFGTNVGANRFFAKYLRLDNKARATNYIAWNIKLLSLTFLITFILAFAAFGLMLLLHHLGIRDINRYHLAIYTLWLVPFSAINTLLISFLLSTDRIFISSMFSNIFKYLFELTLFIIVVLFIDPTLNNTNIILVLFFSFVLLSTLSTLSMNKEVLLILETGIKKLLKTSLSQMDWLRTSSRLIANNIIFSVTCTIDLLAVEIFSSNESNVGLYAAILTIISFLWLIPTNIYQGLKPNLALMLSDINKRSELQSKLNRTNLVAFILIGIQGFLIIFFSREILLHFGPHYIAAQPALIILTLGVCFSCIARIAPVLLVYAGDEQIVLKWSIVELLLMFLLVIPATYYFDIIGTASATTVVLIIKPFVTILIARKTLNLRPISIF